MGDSYNRPGWAIDVAAAIEQRAQDSKAVTARKMAAVVKRAERARTPTGRFLRTKYGKGYIKGKRQIRWVSIPIDIDVAICAEAQDCGISISRMLATLVALGVAQWPAYRAASYSGPTGEEPIPIPRIVGHILENASNPQYVQTQPAEHIAAWRRELDARIRAEGEAKKRRIREKSSTQRVLESMGIKSDDA